MSNSDSLLVLYGSQTGNAQSIAEDTFLEASMKGFNPKIQSLNDFYNQVRLVPQLLTSLA